MIYLFNDVKELTGTVRNNHILNLLYEREKNGIYSVSAEIPVTYNDQGTIYNYNKKIQKSDFLGHYDKEGRFQLHKIAAVDIENGAIFVKGIHIFFDEAKAGAIIKDRRFVNREIIDGARVAFESIGWSVADFDVSVGKTYNFYNVTPLEARQILVETFGFEFDYWLDFDGKKVTNRHVAVKEKIGEKTNKRYTYGHNVLNIRAEQDYSEIYTAVIGRGKGEEIEETGGYGRRIEYTDVVWTTPSKPLNKPAGTRILEDPNATQLFGYKENGVVKPRIKVEVFSDIETPTELIQASYEWLMDNNVPKAVFSLKVADGDGLNLGDEVYVIYRDIDLVKSARVEKVIDDLVSGNRDVEFGDTAYFDTDRRLSGMQSELKQYRSEQGGAIYNQKKEFDRRFEEEVEAFRAEFEQAKIDILAEVEADRVRMEAEFDQAINDWTESFDADVEEAYRKAEENYERISGEITTAVDTARDEIEQDYNAAVEEAKRLAREEHDRISGEVTTSIDTAKSELEQGYTDAMEQAKDYAEQQAQEKAEAVRTDLETATSGHQQMLDDLESDVMNIDEFLGDSRDVTLDERLFSINESFEERIRRVDSNTFNMLRGTQLDEPDVYRLLTGATLDSSERINFVNVMASQSSWAAPRVRFEQEVRIEAGKKYIFAVEYRTDSVPELDWFRIQRDDGLTDLMSYSDGELLSIQTDGEWNRAITEFTFNQTITGKFEVGTHYASGDGTRESLHIRLPYLTGSENTEWVYHPLDATQNISEVTQRIMNLEDGYSELITRSEFNFETGQLDQYIKSVESTVEGNYQVLQRVEDWQATNGASIEETIYGFDQKVWLNDVADIGANLIPQSSNAWENGGLLIGNGGNTNLMLNIRLKERIPVQPNTTYTLSSNSAYLSAIERVDIHQYLTTGGWINRHTIPRNGEVTFTTWSTAGTVRITLVAREGFGITPNFVDFPDGRIKIKLEVGSSATPMLNAISRIEQLANSVSIQVQELDGDFLSQSDIQVNPGYVQLGSQRLGDSQLASIFRVSPNSIQAITDRMILNGDLYVDGDITALAVDAIEGNFARLFSAEVTAGTVHADYVEGFAGRFESLYTLNANIERLVAQTVFTNAVNARAVNAIDGRFANLFAAELETVELRARHIGANAIGAQHLWIDTALINKLSTSSLFTNLLYAKTIDAIDINAGQVRAAILEADVITGEHLAVGTSMINKLFATSGRIDQLIGKNYFIDNIKALSIEAVDGQFSSLMTKYFSANYIDVDYIDGKNAWFETQYTKNANIEKLTAQTAFIRDVQAIEITANQLNIQTLHSKLKGVEGGLTIYGPDGRVLINNSVLRASFDVQIRPNHASSAVSFTGLNYATSSDVWQTFEHFYTDFKGSKLLISWAVDFSGSSSSEYVEVRVRGFGGNSPIIKTSNKRIFTDGSTAYLNHVIELGVPDYRTIQAYLEFRRSPTGSSSQNTARVRVLRVSLTD